MLRSLAISFCTALLWPFLVAAQGYSTKNYDLLSGLQHAHLSEAEKAEPAVMLLDKRVVEYVYADGNKLQEFYTHHRLVHINDQSKVESYNRIYLPVNDTTDLLVLKARVISRDGKVKMLSKSDMKTITEQGTDFYILAVEGLEKDAELEYFYTIKKSAGFFITERLQSAVFTRHAEILFSSPQNLIFAYKSYNGEVHAADTVLDGRRLIHLTKDSITTLNEEEKYATYQANELRVEFKLVKNTAVQDDRLFTWQDAGRRYFQLYHQQQKSARKDIARLADKLKLEGKNPEVQIRLLESYLKSVINIQETGEEEEIGAMLKRKYGSEVNVVSLYALMFESLNISYEVVVTSNRMVTPFDPDFDTWNYLDKTLFYFPDLNMYMDPANYTYRLGAIPFQYSGTYGLFIKKITVGESSTGLAAVKKITSSSFEKNYDRMVADITFDEIMNNVNINFDRTYNGDADNQVRAAYYYARTEDREKIIKDLLESAAKDMKINSSSLKNFNLDSDEYLKPVKLEANITSGAFVEQAGDKLLFLVGDIIGKQTEMYQEHQRQNPIEVYFAHSYNRTINVHVPKGYTMKGLEKLNFNVIGKDGGEEVMGFVSKYKLVDDLLTISIDEYYKKVTMPVSAFEDFKKVINASADFNKVKLVLVKN